MLDAYSIKEYIKAYLELELPAVLNAAPDTEDFQEYRTGAPEFVDHRELAVFTSDGNRTESEATEAMVIHCQLPGVLDPMPYQREIWPVVLAFDPETVGADSKMVTHVEYYPGEASDGGGSAFVIFEVTLNAALDDCD